MKMFRIMGIVNVTPDSFSDGGQFNDDDSAIKHGLRLWDEGADILDIGGESTRPGAEPVSVDEELGRVLPVIKGLHVRTDLPISIDTRKPEVARAAADAGASIWNDVSALTYTKDSLTTAAALGLKIVLMHAQGDPKTMQRDPQYKDVVEEVFGFLESRIDVCVAAGVARNKIIIDPGIGFGKTLAHNLALLAGLDRLSALNAPILVGVSRKRFLEGLDRAGPAAERLGGSIAGVIASFGRGASIFRVHDVAETRQALAVYAAIEKARCLR